MKKREAPRRPPPPEDPAVSPLYRNPFPPPDFFFLRVM
jgi:hypothetical protein